MAKDIKEERSHVDEAGKHADHDVVVDVDDPWVKYMEAKLAFKSKHCKPSHPFNICRVPRHIRSVDNAAHDASIVSIGPYNRGKPSLHEMEEVKWRNLNKIRGRACKDFHEYLKAMKEIEPDARACYSGNINMEADEFIEMMLLDGLFIIEFISKRYQSIREFFSKSCEGNIYIDEEETIYTIRGMLCRVGHDMLLLENQLPFFVLQRLWNLTDRCSPFDLWKSACIVLYVYALQIEHEFDIQPLQEIFDEKENPEMINEDGVHHLLHLVYLLLITSKKSKPMEPPTVSSSESKEPTGSADQSKDPTAKLSAFIKKILSFLRPRCPSFPSPSACQKSQFTETLSAFIQKILPCLSPCMCKEEQPPPTVIPCAAELDEAGVEFKLEKEAQSFLDVKFEQGTLKMPHLMVEDSTKSLLRNFIAYEQCFPNQGSHFTSYCSFMDDLVNTPRDVEILKKSGIIESRLGCDKEVADLFNDLCKGIVLPDEGSNYLTNPSKEVREHTKNVWPKWRAKLLHDYFGSPWSIISVLGATFIIILTIVQTYYAVFT